MQKVLIYSPKITGRVSYIFDFALTDYWGIPIEITSNIQYFEASDQPKINYSDKNLDDGFYLESDDFMFENKLNPELKPDQLNPVGKCFFAISRYQEYLPHQKDKHGRFSGVEKVYKTPFVDQWLIEFKNELNQKYPELKFKKREFKFILTSDVDQVWKYRNKGFLRTYGGLFKDLIKLDFKTFSKKKAVLNGREKDPFDTFDYFKELQEKRGFEIIFFWLMADYSTYDKNNPVTNPEFQQKIKEISKWAQIGIHPSYASNEKTEKLKVEIYRLEKISQKKITQSRQHYIRLSFPDTYRNLIKNGISDDYTMAYADETGFRAGTCSSFYWFDLLNDQKTNLRIHPFCAMEVSMRNYMKLNEKEAIAELNRLKTEIQKVDGQMILLFHNSNLNEDWTGWKKVLESVF